MVVKPSVNKRIHTYIQFVKGEVFCVDKSGLKVFS